MLQPGMCFTVFVFSAILLSAPISSSARQQQARQAPPLELYTSDSCQEKGVNYDYYEGDLNAKNAKPLKQGKLRYIALPGDRREYNFSVKFTGYLKVDKCAGVYKFHIDSVGTGRAKLHIGSKTVIDAGQERGEIHLTVGVHPVTLTYRQHDKHSGLEIACRIPLPPWHVKDAEIRFPLTVDIAEALHCMPPQVYLADLKPLTIKDITFDPKSKNANLRDLQKKEEKAKAIARQKKLFEQNKLKWEDKYYYSRIGEREGGPIIRIQGSATYAVKPEYKWFSRIGRDMRFYVDNKQISDYRRAAHGVSLIGAAEMFPIPPGAKTLKLDGAARYLHQPGFITQGPSVARATLCLPGRDPTALIPIVHRLTGQRVACRIVWAYPGEPMSILLDCSSGDSQYMVYMVDRAKKPSRLAWIPKAGIIQETRFLDRYDPAVGTYQGFQKLWDKTDFIAGKRVPIYRARVSGGGYAGTRPIYRDVATQALHEAGFLPFGPARRDDKRNYWNIVHTGAPTLTRYTGFFSVPTTGEYSFHFHAYPGGYLLFDDRLASEMPYGHGRFNAFAVKLEKGLHRAELCIYSGRGERFGLALRWDSPIKHRPPGVAERDALPDVFGDIEHEPAIGRKHSIWAPMAGSTAGASGHRSNPLHASFTWTHLNTYFKGMVRGQTVKYCPQDINSFEFTASLPGAGAGAVFRWRFDNALAVEGKKVVRDFLSPGTKKVRLDVLSAPGGKPIASASGEIDAHVNWALLRTRSRGQPRQFEDVGFMFNRIWERSGEFGSIMPIEELVDVYYWTHNSPAPRRPKHNTTFVVKGDWLELRKIVVAAMARRTGEIIKTFRYHRLLDLGQHLSAPNQAADYDTAEKFLKVAMDRAPAGGFHWRAAVLALADIHVALRNEAEKGLELIEKLKKTRRINDLTVGWEAARVRKRHDLTPADKLGDLTKGLQWVKTDLPLEVNALGVRGFWLARDIEVPSGFKGKPLVLDPGPINHSGLMWFNGEPLGETRRGSDGSIVVPAAMLRPGGTNRFTALVQPRNRHGFSPRVSSPAISSDFQHLVRNHDGTGTAYHARGMSRHEGYFPRHLSEVRSMTFSPDSKRVASGSRRGIIKIWDTDSKKELLSFNTRSGIVRSLAFSPDGRTLASGGSDQQIRLWDPASGKPLRVMNANSGTVVSLAFSPDSKRLASGSRHRTVKVWDTASGKELLALDGHSGAVYALAFSPDGKTLASGIDNTHIRLWDTNSGKPLRTLEGQSDQVLALAFSPDSKRLASGSYDRLVGLWDLKTGKKLATGYGHKNFVTTVAFSPDGKQLVSVGFQIKFWTGDTLTEQREIANMTDQTARDEKLWVHGPRTRVSGGWSSNSIGSFGEGVNRQFRDYKRLPKYKDYPVELFTSRSCDVAGVNYACYKGDKWDKMPDFDKIEPVNTGIIQHICPSGVHRVLPPTRLRVKEKDRDRWVEQCTGIKITGFIRVTDAADYEFSLKSLPASRLTIDAKPVVYNDGTPDPKSNQGQVKRGSIHLAAGVHPVTLTYFHTNGHRQLEFTFPKAFVRTLRRSEVMAKRIEADALLRMGKTAEAKKILMNLERGAWPVTEMVQMNLNDDLRQVRQRLKKGNGKAAMTSINSWLDKHPMLRTVPAFMIAKIETLTETSSIARAIALVDQVSGMVRNEAQRRHLILTRIKLMIKAGKMKTAVKIYGELKKIAPYSTTAVEARKALKEAILENEK